MGSKILPFKNSGKQLKNDCPCGSGKSYKRCCAIKSNSTEDAPIRNPQSPANMKSFDLEKEKMFGALNQVMETTELDFEEVRSMMIGKTFDNATDSLSRLSPAEVNRIQLREKLDELLELAEMTSSTKKRIAIARDILAQDPDYSDAFLILADADSKTTQQAIRYFEAAIKAAERKLGKEKFESAKGHFWGMNETRPYMRARFLLASAMWQIGRRIEAIVHLEEMLALNPSDNQGLRYFLINWYLFIGDHKKADQLMNRYEDDAGLEYAFGQALSLFMKEGQIPEVNAVLRRAIERNPLALVLLLHPEQIPELLPDGYSIGSPEEAMLFAHGASEVWLNIPEAMEWLQKITPKTKRR